MADVYDYDKYWLEKNFSHYPETRGKKFEFSVQKIVKNTVNMTIEMINEGIIDPVTIQNAIQIEIDHIKMVYGEYDIKF